MDHEFRKKHIGGSDIPIIVGISPWDTCRDLWLLKTGQTQPKDANIYMQLGTLNEPRAREDYIIITGLSIAPYDELLYKQNNVMMASLDGVDEDFMKVVEIKCPQSDRTYNLAKEGKIEANYYVQIQWQLMVSEAQSADFFVWKEDKEPILIKDIKPDPDLINLLYLAAAKFWDSVELFYEPDPDFLVKEIKEMLSKIKMVQLKDPSVPRKDKDFNLNAQIWKEKKENVDLLKKDLKEAELNLKIASDDLLKVAGDQECYGSGVKVSYSERKGLVNWKAVQEAYSIDDDTLESFRKDPVREMKINLMKE